MKTSSLNFYKVSKIYGNKDSDKYIHLFLDTDKFDKITAFYFIQKGFDHLTDKLEVIRELILGKKISEAREINLENSSFINIPHLILIDLIEEYKGGKNFSELASEDSLICRCFGITSSQITKMMKVSPDSTSLDVTNELNAGGGCTSCAGEVEEIVKKFKIQNNIETVSPRKRYLGMTPSEIILKADESLKAFTGVKVVRLKGDFLFLKCENFSKEEIKKRLDQDFTPHFPLGLLFV